MSCDRAAHYGGFMVDRQTTILCYYSSQIMTQDLSILLQQYCELNELPYHASWDKVIEHQISHPNTTIEYHTPYGRLFHLTHQVINNTLEAHTFMTLGDTYNPVSTTPRS